MRYIAAVLSILIVFNKTMGQGTIPEYFLDGKAAVLISSSPQAVPNMDWHQIAELIHPAIVSLGGDPVAYYELEDVALSEEVQAGYASAFNKRMIQSIVLVTRKSNGQVAFHISPYSKNKNIVTSSGAWGITAASLDEIIGNLQIMGQNIKTRNFLVLEIPEFPNAEGALQGSKRFINRNPLNLDVFKLGIPLSGASGDIGQLASYRYDLLGKSEQTILAEQQAERSSIEQVFETHYPYQFEFLTNARGDAELIQDRIQFILVKLEGKEGDLMTSMGFPVEKPEEKNSIVVKYYIRLIIRDELYTGPVWDADPDWQKALAAFLENLKIK